MLHALTQLIVVLLIFAFARPSFADPAAVASKMFSRLTGTPLFVDDPRRVEMETAIVAGDLVSAAKIATQDPGFYNVTLRRWAAPMSNRGLSPRVQLNDFTAIIVGLTRDDLDFRLALTGDIRYVADPNVDYAKIYYGPTTTNVIKPGTAVQDNIMYGVLDPLRHSKISRPGYANQISTVIDRLCWFANNARLGASASCCRNKPSCNRLCA